MKQCFKSQFDQTKHQMQFYSPTKRLIILQKINHNMNQVQLPSPIKTNSTTPIKTNTATPIKSRRQRLQSNNIEYRRNANGCCINKDSLRQLTEPNGDVSSYSHQDPSPISQYKQVFPLSVNKKDQDRLNIYNQYAFHKRYTPSRKLSEDQLINKQHYPKSPPILPQLNQSTFDITFQNPFFADSFRKKSQERQPSSDRRPQEFQGIVYKRKNNKDHIVI